jgi:hypothetical protein
LVAAAFGKAWWSASKSAGEAGAEPTPMKRTELLSVFARAGSLRIRWNMVGTPERRVTW